MSKIILVGNGITELDNSNGSEHVIKLAGNVGGGTVNLGYYRNQDDLTDFQPFTDGTGVAVPSEAVLTSGQGSKVYIELTGSTAPFLEVFINPVG